MQSDNRASTHHHQASLTEADKLVDKPPYPAPQVLQNNNNNHHQHHLPFAFDYIPSREHYIQTLSPPALIDFPNDKLSKMPAATVPAVHVPTSDEPDGSRKRRFDDWNDVDLTDSTSTDGSASPNTHMPRVSDGTSSGDSAEKPHKKGRSTARLVFEGFS